MISLTMYSVSLNGFIRLVKIDIKTMKNLKTIAMTPAR